MIPEREADIRAHMDATIGSMVAENYPLHRDQCNYLLEALTSEREKVAELETAPGEAESRAIYSADGLTDAGRRWPRKGMTP